MPKCGCGSACNCDLNNCSCKHDAAPIMKQYEFPAIIRELVRRLQMWSELQLRPMQLQMKGVGVFDMKRHKLE
ncbi:hypothetical protein SDJN02_11346 [Cucurbita argyrosperma subsp. argyrosperma]|nr:hypothetical protein SDJN02_11346 [Cucurbita argyrosperma subsp. argyrosperma]